MLVVETAPLFVYVAPLLIVIAAMCVMLPVEVFVSAPLLFSVTVLMGSACRC